MAVQRIERQLAADQSVCWRSSSGSHRAPLRALIEGLEMSLPGCAQVTAGA